MKRKIRGLVTARYAYADPARPQCFIVKDKEYEERVIGVAMTARILELKGAIVVGDLQHLNLDETGFIPEETDLEDDDSADDSEEDSKEEDDSTGESEEDDSEEEDDEPEDEEPEAEPAETTTRRKGKSTKRKGKNR